MELSERLDKHIQSIREIKEIDYKGTKVLIDPNKQELDHLFRNNKKVFGYVLSNFSGPENEEVKIVHSIWYGITGKEEFPGSIAYDLEKKYPSDWFTSLEIDSKTREVEYSSSFSISHEEAIDVCDFKMAISWAKFHKEIATKYGVKWLHNYKKYIDNWSRGKDEEGNEFDEDSTF